MNNNIIPNGIDFFIVCDLETTGTDPMRCDWITGSFSRMRVSDLIIESEIELKSRPSNHWDDEARYIHRIPYHKAIEFPERKKTLQNLIDWLPPREKFAFVCHANPTPWIEFGNFQRGKHNSHFDLAMIKWDFTVQERYFDFYKIFDEKKIISTQEISRNFFGVPKEFDLKRTCDMIGIKMSGDHHDCKADRVASQEILKRFLNESGRITLRNRDSKLNSRVFKVQKNHSVAKQQRFDV